MDDGYGPRLARYIAGECTETEAEEIRLWIGSASERRHEAESLQRVWEATGDLPAHWDSRAAWGAMVRRRTGVPVSMSQTVAAKPRVDRRWIQSGIRIAAVLVFAVISGVMLGHRRDAAPSPTELRTVTTERGQRSTIELSDGTHVTLGPASVLRFAAGFPDGARNVVLEGEAYFDVAHDRVHPFTVHTRYAATRVLGTRFTVHAFANDTVVRVLVAEGRVALGTPEHAAVVTSAVLSRGQQGTLTQGGAVRVSEDVNVDDALAWRTGALRFRRAPLRDVVRELERWYDIEIRLAEPALGEVPVTAVFPQGTASEAVRTLARVVNLQVVINGKTVHLTSRGTGR